MNFEDRFTNYKIDNFGYVRLPYIEITNEECQKYGIKDKKNHIEFLKTIAYEGLKERASYNSSINKNYKEYKDRIERELNLYEELSFVDYILLVWKVCNFCNDNKIVMGYGRGSAAGSLVFYCIGVTHRDPIHDELFFERFVSKARAKKKEIDGVVYIDGALAPDVDIDIEQSRRHEVVEYVKSLYPSRVCKITTLTSLKGKLLIKECGKIIDNLSEDEMRLVADMVPSESGFIMDIEEAYGKIDTFKAWCDKHPQAYQIALKLRNLIKNKSSHASGYVVSYYELDGWIPTEKSIDGELTTSYNMDSISKLAIKLDLLGLRCASVIGEVLTTLNLKKEDINIDDDPVIYENLYELKNPQGIFQLEASCNLGVNNAVHPQNLGELSDIVAMARPGGLHFVSKYCNNEHEPIHELFDPLLEQTRGCILYQEQLMKLSNAIGFSLEEAEQIRRCITGDTYFISKTRGYITINTLLKDGYKNDLFLVMDEKGNQQWKPIKEIWSNGTHQARYVEARNGMHVKASQWHQFLTDTGWKARKHLKDQEDYLLCAKSINYDGKDRISENCAIVCAGLITEGYFVDGRHATFTNHDDSIMQRFEIALKNEYGKDYSFNDNNCYVLRMRNSIKNQIKQILPQGKSISKVIPDIMMGLTLETTRKFLSFMFACEGTFTINELSFTSKSNKLIQQIQLLLLRFDIRSYILVKRNKKYGNYYTLNIKEKKEKEKFLHELSLELQEYKKNKLIENINITKYNIQSNTTDIIPKKLFRKYIEQYGYTLNGESGRLYNGNISRDKFSNIVYRSKDIYWEELSNGKQEYSLLQSTKKDIREIEVFDFTIDEDTPYIIANGMIIHNCVGKKKIKEVAQWKTKVEDKIEKNNLPKELGNILWETLEASAKYSFNKSHAICYAAMAALTVYLKYKYPLQFYIALLKQAKDEPNPTEEITKIQSELQYFGIKLLAPNIHSSEEDFTIENNDIRFGLSCIKGISSKSLVYLTNFKADYANKFELFSAAKMANINISILSAIIQAGAINHESYYCSRSKLVYEAHLWNVLTDREKTLCLDLGNQNDPTWNASSGQTQCFNYDLARIVFYLANNQNEKGKLYIKESRFQTIKKKAANHKQVYLLNSRSEKLANWYYERCLLGFSYSEKLKNIFQTEYDELIDIRDMNDTVEMDSFVTIVGIVDDVISRTAKNEKKTKYQKITISDETGMIPVLVFNDHIERIKASNNQAIGKENIVVVKGIKKDNAIFANDISIQDYRIYMKFNQIKQLTEN